MPSFRDEVIEVLVTDYEVEPDTAKTIVDRWWVRNGGTGWAAYDVDEAAEEIYKDPEVWD